MGKKTKERKRRVTLAYNGSILVTVAESWKTTSQLHTFTTEAGSVNRKWGEATEVQSLSPAKLHHLLKQCCHQSGFKRVSLGVLLIPTT